MVASGADLVVTDGNRRRATGGHRRDQSVSPTLAPGEPTERVPGDLFGSTRDAERGHLRDAAWITASRYGFPLSPYEAASRPRTPSTASSAPPGRCGDRSDPDGESVTVELREPTTVTAVSVLPQ